MEIEGTKIHVLSLCYPAEGHITPLSHFTKRLSSKGLKITLLIPNIERKSKSVSKIQETSTFKIDYISDGSENGQSSSIEDYFSRLNGEVSKNLALFIEKLSQSNQLPHVLVYDSTMPWALEVAHKYGVRSASFFTECCAVNCIFYHIFHGTFQLNSLTEQSIISLPPLPPLQIDDFPCYPSLRCFNQTVLEKYLSNQFINIQKADWIFMNTFDKLESEVVSWMASKLPIKTIGPTIVEGNKFIKKCEHSCIKWLDKRELNSVVYVSFGTVVNLSEEQMEEIARALVSSNCYFLWIVRTEEESKLPQNFKSEVSEKGLILEWCPQLEVLAHEAVACTMTHCGWNSTIESLSYGVPMIAMPSLVAQISTAKFIADVWEAGVRVKVKSNGTFTREEIEMSIREVTQTEKGRKLKQNALKWKQEIEKAIAPGGSSSKNIDDFVIELSNVLANK